MHADVTAVEPAAAVLTILAKIPGVAGNSIGLSETSTNVTVSAATLTGGAE